MTPQEIAFLKHHSPKVRYALKKPGMWEFLRQKVTAHYGTQGFLPLWDTHYYVCDHCHELTPILVGSPYNHLYPGWCIHCVLVEYDIGPIEYPRSDPRSCTYDPATENAVFCIIPYGPPWFLPNGERDPNYEGPPELAWS